MCKCGPICAEMCTHDIIVDLSLSASGAAVI